MCSPRLGSHHWAKTSLIEIKQKNLWFHNNSIHFSIYYITDLHDVLSFCCPLTDPFSTFFPCMNEACFISDRYGLSQLLMLKNINSFTALSSLKLWNIANQVNSTLYGKMEYFSRGGFTIYVYNTNWVGGKKYLKLV